MSDKPEHSAPVPRSEAAREKRLAQALRANLKKRKAQARARDASEPDCGTHEPTT
jgi:hypothetical protein